MPELLALGFRELAVGAVGAALCAVDELLGGIPGLYSLL